MGLGPPVLALYRQLKQLGAFEGIHDVMELGAQNVWCPKAGIVRSLFEAFGKPPPPADMLERFATWKGSARELYAALGFEFHCIDVGRQVGQQLGRSDLFHELVRLYGNLGGHPRAQIARHLFRSVGLHDALQVRQHKHQQRNHEELQSHGG